MTIEDKAFRQRREALRLPPDFPQKLQELQTQLKKHALFTPEAPRMSAERFWGVKDFEETTMHIAQYGSEKEYPLTTELGGRQIRDPNTFRKVMATRFRDLAFGLIAIPYDTEGSNAYMEVGNAYRADPAQDVFSIGQAVTLQFPTDESPVTIAKITGDLFALPIGGKVRLTNGSIAALNVVLSELSKELDASQLPHRTDSMDRYPVLLK